MRSHAPAKAGSWVAWRPRRIAAYFAPAPMKRGGGDRNVPQHSTLASVSSPDSSPFTLKLAPSRITQVAGRKQSVIWRLAASPPRKRGKKKMREQRGVGMHGAANTRPSRPSPAAGRDVGLDRREDAGRPAASGGINRRRSSAETTWKTVLQRRPQIGMSAQRGDFSRR